MEAFCAKWTAQTWPAGDLLPSRLTIFSKFFVDRLCVILAIGHFQGPPRAATTPQMDLFFDSSR